MRIDKIPLLFDTHVNNILQTFDQESDVYKYKTLYIPEAEYDAIIKQIGLRDSLKNTTTKIDIIKDDELFYMIRSQERREADMKMLSQTGKIAK